MTSLSLLVSLPDKPSSLDILAAQLSWDKQKAKQARNLYQNGLPPLVDTHTLPYIFGVRPKFISAMGLYPDRYYRRFPLRKYRGGERTIASPRRALKVIQQWINRRLLSNVKVSAYVMGFVKGRNIVDNAQIHTAGRNLMVVDISDFFPSVQIDAVREVFREIGFPDSVAHQLALLCSIDGGLPQGAPTSPAIANAVFRRADVELNRLANSWRCRYSRYADDLAFSGRRRFTQMDVRRVGTILKKHGFAINRQKCRRIGPGGRQLLTGLLTNKVAHPPRWKRRMWRAVFHRASKHPLEFANGWVKLLGIAAFVNQYDRVQASQYRKIARIVARYSRKQRSEIRDDSK